MSCTPKFQPRMFYPYALYIFERWGIKYDWLQLQSSSTVISNKKYEDHNNATAKLFNKTNVNYLKPFS